MVFRFYKRNYEVNLDLNLLLHYNLMVKVYKMAKDYWSRENWHRDSREEHPTLGEIHRRQRILTVKTISEFSEQGNRSISVADLCCGTGKVTEDISRLPYIGKITAVDINQHNIDFVGTRLQESLCEVDLICGDIEDGIAKDEDRMVEKLDLIVCLDAIHHFPDPQGVLDLLYKLLNYGGILVGNVMGKERRIEFLYRKYGIRGPLGYFTEILTDTLLPQESGMRESLFYRFGLFRLHPFNAEELNNLLTSSGFSDIYTENDFYHWFRATK